MARLDSTALESVAELFQSLAEPTRLAILQELKSSPLAVGEIVERLCAKQANVSKQLGVLFRARILTRERVGNTVHYSIRDPLVFELCELVCGKLKRDAERQSARFAKTTKARNH